MAVVLVYKLKEEFVANYFLLKSDPKHYAGLIASIQNDFTSRQDKYPKTLSKAYNIIVNYLTKRGELTCRSRGCLSIRMMTTSTKDKDKVVESPDEGLDKVNEEDNYHLEVEHEQFIGGAANTDNHHSERLYPVVLPTSNMNSP
jgi:hypothetical protein